jgi:hypothetical protein
VDSGDTARHARLPGMTLEQVLDAPPGAPGALLQRSRSLDNYRPQGWISPVLLVNGGMDGV